MTEPTLDFQSILSDPEQLLTLETEELAGYLIVYLNDRVTNGPPPFLNRDVFINDLLPPGIWDKKTHQIQRALFEAWQWLENEGLLAPMPEGGPDTRFITKGGTRLKSLESFRLSKRGNCFQRHYSILLSVKKSGRNLSEVNMTQRSFRLSKKWKWPFEKPFKPYQPSTELI